MSSIAKGGVLKPESQWNTELILELCKIEQVATVAAVIFITQLQLGAMIDNTILGVCLIAR